MTEKIIHIENLYFKYKQGTDYALKDISLEIKAGEFVGVIGNSGAGKTSFTCALNGMIPHHYAGDFYGAVHINGMDTVNVKPVELARFVGSVFQDVDAQMVAAVVEDELLFGLENFGVPHEEIEERIQSALHTIGIEHLRNRVISTLSGGQKQKVAIAAIVALRPQLLVLDEPTGELDPMSSRQIYEMLRILNEAYGMTIIIVEQKIMLLCEFAKRLLVFEQGSIAFDGATKEVLKYKKELEELGVNVPRIVSLADRMKKRGYDVAQVPVNLAEAKEMVEEVLLHA
jgi:energy-coupling factor transport system ATP-binding protein